jgi:hypothetical protein
MYKVSYVNGGSRTAFYQLDDNRGFKEFACLEDAEYAYQVQDTLARSNLAPKVLSEIGRIRMPKNLSDKKLSGWGYITEIAEVIGCGGNECDCGECEDLYDNMQRKVDNLINKISDAGYNFADAHVGNVGYVKRKGRKILVCIDTGEESVFDESGYQSDYESGCSCSYCQAQR